MSACVDSLLVLLGVDASAAAAGGPALGSCLVDVARAGRTVSVRSLLASGVSVDARSASPGGVTALMAAAAAGDPGDVIDVLLDAGADVAAVDEVGAPMANRGATSIRVCAARLFRTARRR